MFLCGFWVFLILGIHGPPYRWSFRVRIAGCEQQLRLMCAQRARRFRAHGPPLEWKRPLDKRLVASQNP